MTERPYRMFAGPFLRRRKRKEVVMQTNDAIPGCRSAWSEDWTCNRAAGHIGQHRDKRNGYWFFAPEAPEHVPPPTVVASEAPFTDYDG